MSGTTKKDDIVQATIEIFVNEGFDRPSMDSIASRANVSKRTLYKHFPSKRSLLDEILLFLIGQKQNALNFTYDSEQSAQDQLIKIVSDKAHLILCPNNIKLAKIIMSEFLKDEGFLKGHIETVLKSETTTLTWIEEAQKAGKIKNDQSPLEMLEFLNELVNGLIFFPVLFGKKENFSNNEIQNIVKMFLHIAGEEK